MNQAYLENSKKLLELLNRKLSSELLYSAIELGDVVVQIAPEKAFDFLKILRMDTEFKFDFFVSVTAVDWLDAREHRYEVVYHLLSLPNLYRLRVKVELPEEAPEIDSVVSLWPGANFMEREAWDMVGIKFRNHPDLRRILMYEEFKGHPLRKDYPVQGKQPRIPLIHPEVHNTARDMIRPELVQIRKQRQAKGAETSKSQ
ncbi:MAG: NADH-quinone oxidoreductase subunit C [Deltaproteobacteria bacterium]|nr:NADH-quinone oxidoreductase subunit C [Deltaproteobacteria bacterium]